MTNANVDQMFCRQCQAPLGNAGISSSGWGDIAGIPGVLDAGQCNDSYSLAVIALALKDAFNLKDVNSLPIAFDFVVDDDVLSMVESRRRVFPPTRVRRRDGSSCPIRGAATL